MIDPTADRRGRRARRGRPRRRVRRDQGRTVIGAGRDPGRRGARQVAEARALLDRRAGRRSPPLVVGDGAVVCCGAIVFAGARLGEGVIVGDQAYVRERVDDRRAARVIGRGARVDNDMRDRRAREDPDRRLHHRVHDVVEDDVFVGPGVCTTNDDTMSRHDKSLRAARAGAPARVPGRRRRGATPRRRDRRGGVRRRGRGRHEGRPARAVVMGVPGARRARGARRGPAGALALDAPPAQRVARAATTSSACARSSTGLIGTARFVRAASSVPGRFRPSPHSCIAGCRWAGVR